QLVDLVRVPHRAPELDLDVVRGRGRRNHGGGRSGVLRFALVGRRGDGIEIHRAGQAGVVPGQLVLAGLFVDLGTDLGHRLLDLDAGLGDVGDQRTGEGRVGAALAVKR